MQKTKLLSMVVVLLSLTGCQMSAVRNVASEKDLDGVPALAEPQVHSGSDMFIKKRQVYLHDGSINQWKAGKLNLKKHSLGTPEGLNAFQAHVDSLMKGESAKALPKGAKRSLREIQAILNTLVQMKVANASAEAENDVLSHLYELTASFNYNFQLPVKEQMWVLAAPIEVLGKMAQTTMGKKAKPANNVVGAGVDSSFQNPVNSSFWVQPTDLEKRNLYYGFNRKSLPEFSKPCKYKDPKKSYGTHGGFEIKCDGQTYKIKFGNETKTEPFNSRIFWALGYNATPIDYTRGVQVTYDRKLLTEYNSRKDLTMNIKSALGFSYYKHHLQKTLDPFHDAIASARLVDGRTLSSAELKTQLLTPAFIAKSQVAAQVITDADVNAEFEKQVAVLIMREGSVEGENEAEQSLGPWSWNDFDHPDRRELRGFSVFASFLNMFDVRTDNNRLRIYIDEDGQKKLKHYVSDLGSGLGNASNLLKFSNGQFNVYPWEFVTSRPTTVHVGPKAERRQQTPYAPLDYQPLEYNEAFMRAQPDDVKWAARLLARLSEEQLMDAMIASGFTAGETKLVLEKMVARRQNLMRVFDLGKEYPSLMGRIVDRLFNYDPKSGEVPQAQGSRDRKRAEAAGVIQKGQLVP